MNFLLTILRQYWKYKFRDVGMIFATLIVTSGAAILLSDNIWNIIIALDLFYIPQEIPLKVNEYSGFGIFLIIVGLAIGIVRLIDLGKQLTGILIIHRGMEGMDTNSIQKALPKSLSKGKLEIIDLHEGHQIYQGKVSHPERALDVINNLDQQIKTRLNGRDINDVQLAYGGLAPIPLLVAAGFKITSRQNCLILDYSRTTSWHGLDDIDDMEKITIKKPTKEITDEVAIIMPFSVEITEEQLPDELIGKAYTINLQNGARPDSLNSIDKQNRVANEFYTLCANMKGKHPEINEIHLYMASQASFSFKLGTMITTSVMPKISVYQYNSTTGKYDWGVTISGENKLKIT